MSRILILGVTLFLCAFSSFSQTDPWLTYFEQSNGMRTPRYDETVAYCRRLANSSPLVKYMSFGKSPQGRDLPLVILSHGAFTPAAARPGKAVVLIQSCIHAGEPDGKDASLMLIRDIAIRGKYRNLLDSLVVLFVPIFNVDGHERFSPYNRINQNGPEEMGWRTTAQNLNLNRDYVKADAPEMRAMLKLFQKWLPDLYVDCHVTDGIDFQYDITYATEVSPSIDPAVSRWITGDFLPRVLPRTEQLGHKIFYYVFPREDADLSKGLQGGAALPRFSTGYAALQNRASILIETHMLKPYRTRVEATYAMLLAMLETLGKNPAPLRHAERAADASWANGHGMPVLPLAFDIGKRAEEREFLGMRTKREEGAISGEPEAFSTGEPETLHVPFYGDVSVEDSAEVPGAYLVPQEWTFVEDLLRAHGIYYTRLTAPESLRVDSYKFTDVRWRNRPYEGRQMPSFRTSPITENRFYPAGTIVVPTKQRAAKIVMHLLEPRAPDSFVSWGFFNTIFEQKEYAESYVLEKVGRSMLEEDPALRKQFESKIAADTSFAHSPRARLGWIYDRTPYADKALNVYPVGKVVNNSK